MNVGRRNAVKSTARVVSLAALVATIAPAVMFFRDAIDLPTTQTAMFAATVVWFVSASIWMDR